MLKASLHHSALSSRDIALLLAVAEEGSIRKAAEALGITQPSLSKSIRLIEERLGSSLFERSTSGAQPTAVGEELMARGRQVLLDLASIQRDLADGLRGVAGDVRVGMGGLVMQLAATPLIQTVGREFPGISLNIQRLRAPEIIQGVTNGQLDFAVSHIDDVPIPAMIETRPILRMMPVFIARSGHPLAGRNLGPQDVAAYRLLLPYSFARLDAWYRGFTGSDRAIVATGVEYEALCDLLEQSDDLCLVSLDVLARLQRHFDVIAFEVEGIDFVHETCCIVPHARRLPAPAQHVLRVLEALLGMVGKADTVCAGPRAPQAGRQTITL